jgi:DNA (cytosine-5)-methyltransferase 1
MRRAAPPGAADFEVAAIIGKRTRRVPDGSDEVQYKVRWLGFTAAEDTWEPAGGLEFAQDRVKEFERALGEGACHRLDTSPSDVTGGASSSSMGCDGDSSTITSCEPIWLGTAVRKEQNRVYYSGFSLGGVKFALGEFVYLDGGKERDRMIGRIEQLFEVETEGVVPRHAARATVAKSPSHRVKRVPERYRDSLGGKKTSKKSHPSRMTNTEAECPMFLIVRWCFRFAECFEDTVVAEGWNWGAQLEAERTINARSEIFIAKTTNIADVNNIALTVVGKPAVRHVDQILSSAIGSTGTQRDICLEWTKRSADNYMFRYQFDPETFSFVDVNASGEMRSTHSVTSSEPLRFGDCFSGAGGLSLGLKAAGLQQQFAVENNRDSQRTFMLSHPPSTKLYREGVETFLAKIRAGADGYPRRGDIDVLAGGSPCQPYSLANRFSHHKADDRTELVWTFLDILEHLQPTFWLLENVPPFMTGHRHHIATKSVPSPLPRVIQRLLDMGYQARVVVACSAHYGVPQARRRVFVIASRCGHPLPRAPPPTIHYQHSGGVPGCSDFGQVFVDSNQNLPTPETAGMSVLTAIDDLNSLGKVDTKAQIPQIRTLFQEERDEQTPAHPAGQIDAADRQAVLGDDVALYSNPPHNAFQIKLRTRLDGTRLDVNSYLHNHWVETYKSVCNIEHAAKALSASAAAFPTVMGRSTCLHPLYHRPFTVRERARACALPDWVELRGNLAAQAAQVGNLVPPPVAEAFGREFMIAAGRQADDWMQRAANGFASQSYWGTSAYTERAVASGVAEPGVHYEAASGETCHSIAKHLGFANGFGLADLNRPIYGDTLQVHARLKHTVAMKVTLLIPTASANSASTTAALERHELYHEATNNETPAQIAQKCGCSLDDLIAVNSGNGKLFDHRTKPTSKLKAGTQVLLPAAPIAHATESAVCTHDSMDDRTARATPHVAAGNADTICETANRKRCRIHQPQRRCKTKLRGSFDRSQQEKPSKEPEFTPAIRPADDPQLLVGMKVRMRVLSHGEQTGQIVGVVPTTGTSTLASPNTHVSASTSARFSGEATRLEVLFENGDTQKFTAAQLRKVLTA